MRKKTIMLSLSTPNTALGGSYYTGIELPAEEHEIQDALDRVRCRSKEDKNLHPSIVSSPVLDELDYMRFRGASFDEYNYLAELLVGLSERQMMVLSLLIHEDIYPDEDNWYKIKDVINAVYAVDQAIFIPGIANDVQLGELVIECELNEDIADVPDKVIDLLDREKLGRIQRETDQGVFFDGNYICTATVDIEEIYDGTNLPKLQDKSGGVFRILVTGPEETADETDGSKAEWLELPVDREKADHIAKQHGADRIEDCIALEFESSIPRINMQFCSDMERFDHLNDLAASLNRLEWTDRVKAKAVLAAEQPKTLNEVIEAVARISEYEFSQACADECQYFSAYLTSVLNWDRIPHLFIVDKVEAFMEFTGATATEYGVISARGCPLYPLIGQGEKIENGKRIELEEWDVEPIQKITVEELAQMKDREGLVLRGCGGDPKEWLDGINQLLTEEGILLGGSRFEHCYVFEHNGTTNILFPFGEEHIRVGLLVAWRMRTIQTFAGIWLSDYLGIYELRQGEDMEEDEAVEEGMNLC